MNKTYAIEIIIRERFKADWKRAWSKNPYYIKNEDQVHKDFERNIGSMHQFFYNIHKYCINTSQMDLYYNFIEKLLDFLKEELSDKDKLMIESHPWKFIVRFLDNNLDINNSFKTGMYLFKEGYKTI